MTRTKLFRYGKHMPDISSYFAQIKPISMVASEALDALAQTLSLPKGYLLHQQGQVSCELFIIVRGIARMFYYRNGNDITNQFIDQGGGNHGAR